MKTNHKALFASLAMAGVSWLPAVAMAHPTHDGEPAADLHVVEDSYEECFFDLHPELTDAEFNTFAREAGAIARFRQMTDAETLGKWNFNVSLAMAQTGIDDSKGAWNNTMSHPAEDHDLGHSVAFPRIVLRMGVAERVDVGVYGTMSPGSNFGFIGVESKVALLKQDESMPVSLAVRPNATALLGPKEVWVGNAGVDLSVSRNYRGLSPYLGVAATTSIAVESSDEVDLDNGTASDMAAFAGLTYKWRKLNVAGEAEVGPLTTYSLRLGGSF